MACTARTPTPIAADWAKPLRAALCKIGGSPYYVLDGYVKLIPVHRDEHGV